MTEMYNATADVLHRIYSWVPPQAPVITFPTGASSTMTVATAATQPHIASRSQPAGSGCGASTSAATYDANGNPASADDFNGNRTCHALRPEPEPRNDASRRAEQHNDLLQCHRARLGAAAGRAPRDHAMAPGSAPPRPTGRGQEDHELDLQRPARSLQRQCRFRLRARHGAAAGWQADRRTVQAGRAGHHGCRRQSGKQRSARSL